MTTTQTLTNHPAGTRKEVTLMTKSSLFSVCWMVDNTWQYVGCFESIRSARKLANSLSEQRCCQAVKVYAGQPGGLVVLAL